MSLTWEKSELAKKLNGFTEFNLESGDAQTYEIRGTTLIYWVASMDCVKIRCASVEDAKQIAELVERGKEAE